MPAPAPPRGPVLDWASFSGPRRTALPSVDQATHQQLTTSGRAAIFQALKALRLAPGSAVLVPTYHCPTMVAPVIHAGLLPLFFGLDDRALPRLDAIPEATAARVGAMIVAHYFGQPRSLSTVRAWCDARSIALIEDCSHCFFGQAGERAVGDWGDFATASLTKFFPVPEAGLLVSAGRPLPELKLSRQGLRSQMKGWVDVFEQAHQARRLSGLHSAMGALFGLKNRHGTRSSRTAAAPGPAGSVSGGGGGHDAAPQNVAQALAECDMGRVGAAPLAVASQLLAALPRQRIVTRRQHHYRRLREALAGAPGARMLFDEPATGAPYALPLWVDNAERAERVYQGLRVQGLPVFRWDRAWPATPEFQGDSSAPWRHHVLQLLCHQDLHDDEINRTANFLLALLRT